MNFWLSVLQNPLFNYFLNAIKAICAVIFIGAVYYSFKNRKNRRSKRR